MANGDSNGNTNGNGNGRGIKLDLGVMFQVIAWIVAALLTYGAINARVSVVESKQDASDRRMERIESKLDRVLTRIP